MTDKTVAPPANPCGMGAQNEEESDCRKECGGQSCSSTRKVPTWAVVLAVGAFVIFNVIFLSFAMSVSTPTLE